MERLKELAAEYLGVSVEELKPSGIYEFISEKGKLVYQGENDNHRHFVAYEAVYKILDGEDEIYIQTTEYTGSGDYWYDSIPEYTMDEFSIVKPYPVTVIKYK